jgi:hypothetical protein
MMGNPVGVATRAAIAAKTARSRMRGKLHAYDTLLAGLARDLHDMAAELRQFIQAEHAMVASDPSPGIGTWPPPISPASEMVWWGARHGRVVTHAVRSPVRPTTLWIRVVLMASARVIAGKMVVSRRARMDSPAQGPCAA